ncbi:MAG: VWA domain-containing protein, partial [Planctomycetales bacterium]
MQIMRWLGIAAGTLYAAAFLYLAIDVFLIPAEYQMHWIVLEGFARTVALFRLATGFEFSFLRPYFLFLLARLPLLWVVSFKSLSGLGGMRRVSALVIRSVVLACVILALAEFQLVRTSDRLTTIFLLDLSRSIPEGNRRDMVTYVNAAIKRHRMLDDRAGVVVFGRTAGLEIPPFDDDVQVSSRIETLVDGNYTDLSSAIKLATASFPEDCAKRIVIVTDGNQNRGDALRQAKAAADSGVSVDVVPVSYSHPNEVLVEKIVTPSEIRKGQPIDLRVVLENTSDHNVPGRVILYEIVEGGQFTLNEGDANQKVVIEPGKQVISFRHQIDNPNFYRFEAVFVADNEDDDSIVENNRATALTHVAGSARVLLIENQLKKNQGRYSRLVEALQAESLEVTVRRPDDAFASLAELQPYDTVILADVPRDQFQDEQRIKDLIRNTEHTGSGLIMLGGENSFGAGAWNNSPLEEAMPVNFGIKSDKVVPKGALVMIMHASEMANGNHWQKKIAQAAIQVLGSQDYCGVAHWNGNDRWLWNNNSGGL